jgi:hypothetical protein
VASSARMFFQQIGGSLGVAAFGAIFASRLTDALRAAPAGAHINASGGQLNPAAINQLSAAYQHAVFPAIAHAVDGVFWWAVPASALAFVLAWFIKEVPLRGRAQAPAAQPEREPQLVPEG